MQNDDEIDSPWDSVDVYNPCISWEECVCGYVEVCIWPKGKPAYVFPLCPFCSENTFTIVVWATDN